MDDLEKEKKKGLNRWYLKDVRLKRKLFGDKYHTPGFGLAAQLFAVMCKFIIEKLGPDEGEALIKEAVQYFGRQRGKRIGETVKQQGKPLSFKNWLIYSDIGGENFSVKPELDHDDLVVEVGACVFMNAAEEWDLGEYANFYCKYVDYAILEGYNPDVKLVLDERGKTGKDHCLFRYIMKEENK